MTRDSTTGPVTWAVVPAAGSGSRFGGGQAKQFISTGGVPLVHRTLQRLWACGVVGGLVVVVPSESAEDPSVLPEQLRDHPAVRVCAGGRERSDSVRAGLACLPPDCELVLVHDGARPALTAGLVERVAAAAWQHGASVPVVPAGDTVKQVDDAGRVEHTLDRARLRLAQTPQGFRREVLERAYAWLDEQAPGQPFTDDASLVEASGGVVQSVDGEPDNLKVTVPGDLARLGLAVPRVGLGYDVHRMVAGRPLMLGGIQVPHDQGLLGHSDGDAALHALSDALLGAAGLGDIGRMFPDDDPQTEGAASIGLLRQVVERLGEAGYRVSSADLTIVAQRPRLAEYLPAMARTIAEALEIDQAAVGVKATTEEGMGITGQGQAVAAHAVAVLVVAAGPTGRKV